MLSCSNNYYSARSVKVIQEPNVLPKSCRLLGKVVAEHMFYQKTIEHLQAQAKDLGGDHMVLKNVDLALEYKISAFAYRCQK
jgi:hypothetical protein